MGKLGLSIIGGSEHASRVFGGGRPGVYVSKVSPTLAVPHTHVHVHIHCTCTCICTISYCVLALFVCRLVLEERLRHVTGSDSETGYLQLVHTHTCVYSEV